MTCSTFDAVFVGIVLLYSFINHSHGLHPPISISYLTHWGREMHICQWTRPSLVQKMACRLLGVRPSYEPMCWTLRNRIQWNINLNWNIFIQENAFENVVWKMAAILSWPQCVNVPGLGRNHNDPGAFYEYWKVICFNLNLWWFNIYIYVCITFKYHKGYVSAHKVKRLGGKY